MPVVAVEKLGRNHFRSLRLISNAAGITEARMASERDDSVSAAVRTAVQGKATGGIAAGDDSLDF